MRNHTLNSPHGPITPGEIVAHPVQFVRHVMHNLNSHHEAQSLSQLDDQLLADIGLLRGEVEAAAHLSVSHDALEELEEMRKHHFEEQDLHLEKQHEAGGNGHIALPIRSF